MNLFRFLTLSLGVLAFLGCATNQVYDKNICQKDLSNRELLVSCHDRAFEKLKTDPAWGIETLKRLCDQNHLA